MDIALTVTDASMVAKAKGRSIDLCGTFVASPLVWAVATTGKDPTKPMPPKRFGVSRLGSGSHTMAFYYASQHSNGSGKPTDLDFVVANDFKGLREGSILE